MARWKPVERVAHDIRAQLRARFVAKVDRYAAVSLIPDDDGLPVGDITSYWQRFIDDIDAGRTVIVPGVHMRSVDGCRAMGRYAVDANGRISDASHDSTPLQINKEKHMNNHDLNAQISGADF